MEPWKNTVKVWDYKSMMSQNADVSKTFKDMSVTYNTHLLLYYLPPGGVLVWTEPS
jgi:hypothetical protein